MYLPDDVKFILNTLTENGFPAYAVGGCVRDSLMGRAAKDHDIATAARPEVICRIFPRTVLTGEKYGTLTILAEQPIEVTTFRIDGDYYDGRRPEEVRFTDRIEEDLSRRDLTINAIAYNEESGYVDPFGGREDIASGLLRAVGEPRKRFQEDALRILRVFRFSAELGFSIEARTLEACFQLIEALSKVSTERILIEIYKALDGAHADKLLPLFRNGGLSHLGFQRPQADFSLEALPKNRCCRLAALLYTCGGGRNILTRLRADNQTKRLTGAMLDQLAEPLPETPSDVKRRFSRIPPEIFSDFLRTYGALHRVSVDESLATTNRSIEEGEPWNLSMLNIGGRELVEMGVPEGKPVGAALNFLLRCVIENPERNRRETLQRMVREYGDKIFE